MTTSDERRLKGVIEAVETLDGVRGLEGRPERAVRLREFRSLLEKTLREIAEDDARNNPQESGLIQSFHEPDRATGFYQWGLRLGSLFPPPAGLGGGAAFLARNELGVGTWLAAIADGGPNSHDPLLFIKSTSGQPNDYGVWREIFHERNINGPVSFGEDGIPLGAIAQKIENANGLAYRFAIGLQVCIRTNLSLAYLNSAVVQATWTFPAAFAAQPAISLILPAAGGSYTGIASTDVGSAYCGLGLSSSDLGYRRAQGAANFPAGAQITGVMGIAIGAWGG